MFDCTRLLIHRGGPFGMGLGHQPPDFGVGEFKKIGGGPCKGKNMGK